MDKGRPASKIELLPEFIDMLRSRAENIKSGSEPLSQVKTYVHISTK